MFSSAAFSEKIRNFLGLSACSGCVLSKKIYWPLYHSARSASICCSRGLTVTAIIRFVFIKNCKIASSFSSLDLSGLHQSQSLQNNHTWGGWKVFSSLLTHPFGASFSVKKLDSPGDAYFCDVLSVEFWSAPSFSTALRPTEPWKLLIAYCYSNYTACIHLDSDRVYRSLRRAYPKIIIITYCLVRFMHISYSYGSDVICNVTHCAKHAYPADCYLSIRIQSVQF